MEKVECQAYFRRVEPGMLFWKSPLALHMEHQISATNKLNDKEQPRGRLEARVQTHQEWVVRSCLKDMLFGLDPVDVLVIGDQLFLDHFHGINALGLLQFYHQHLGVAAATNHANQVKVGQ